MIAAHSKLVAFDRPLAGAVAAGQPGACRSEKEVAALAQDAYRRGVDATRALADQQMVEFRADIGQLTDGILAKLGTLESMLVAQLREALPALALEISRRLLAGYEPPAGVVSALCEQALAELFPEREQLELVVSPRDAALLETLRPAWQERYPGLRITTQVTLRPGDCQVRSRFGLTDARLSTKMAALEQSLESS